MSFPSDNTWLPTFVAPVSKGFAAGAAYTVSYVAPYKLRILDAWLVNGAVASVTGDSVGIVKGATTILSCVTPVAGVAAGTTVRADVNLLASNAAAAEIAAGAAYSIVWTSAAGGFTGGTVCLLVQQL